MDYSDRIIDGSAVAATIRNELKEKVKSMENKPGLAVVLVGDRRDSATYVRMKIKACEEVGLNSFAVRPSSEVTQSELLAQVDELNNRADVHGILIQLPLPDHIDEEAILERVLVHKDVDGLHPLNIARLSTTLTHGLWQADWYFDTLEFNVACTPQGCIELLDRIGYPIESKRAVVIGRSTMVGVPAAMLLMRRNATVTIVHSKTSNIPAITREADILIVAAGKAGMVQGDWIKPGAIVLDVGINSVDDSEAKRGYRLVGDCDWESCVQVAGKITPVPGGVGPMTIAMLLRNTVNCAIREQRRKNNRSHSCT
mmetsp:Transcript_1621/g.2571  ORF Transcript_1621/g.2571 Transcript_1621/m.2571 type:complete len:313 (-) Transcript_1621:207-1145(-)